MADAKKLNVFAQGVHEFEVTIAERDNLRKVNRDWETHCKAQEASINELRMQVDHYRIEANKYKAYAVELRTRLNDIYSVIQAAMSSAVGKFKDAEGEKVDNLEPIPRFLKEGPNMQELELAIKPENM